MNRSHASIAVRFGFQPGALRRSFCIAAAAGLSLPCPHAPAQTWTRLTNDAPAGIGLMLLLSDGTVMAQGGGVSNTWYRLTPDSRGRYVFGTWSALAPSHDTRLWFSSQVLRDGRVFIAGGEYGAGTARAEIYDPTVNAWMQINPPTSLLDPSQPSVINPGYTQQFFDSCSALLPNGNVVICPVLGKTIGQTLLYDPVANVWSAGPALFRGVYQDEATWAKLPDGSILTLDPAGSWSYPNNPSERYIPATSAWINDAAAPVTLYDQFSHELGGAALLPDGRSFFLGATGQTALYTPTGTTHAGFWTAGPVIPDSHGTPDAPCAMMVNGKVLCAVSPVPTSALTDPPPVTFYEYDSATSTFAPTGVPSAVEAGIPCYQTLMLCLPNGQVLYTHFGTDLYLYTPGGPPLAAGKPVIQSITRNPDGSYHLAGTGLNGISEGASYGDDAQMASNYPLVRIAHSNSLTYYARTHDWSSAAVRTGPAVLTVEYNLPAGLPPGAYSLAVVGNQFASDPTTAAGTTNPVSVTVCPDGTASFTVSGSGTPTLTYQWRKGNSNLVNGGNVSGATSPNLTISNCTAADAAGDYNCIVTNVFGSATSADAALRFCYANCDCSSVTPALNANDFQCFLNRFAAGDSGANCDGSTAIPVLNANDFQCFLNAFAAGCS